MQKTALITGITGQDGSYLSRLLLEKGYRVHGVVRRSSLPNTLRIDSLLADLTLHEGDMTDALSLTKIVEKVAPDEIYNLAAQSHVHVSFDTPEYTANVNGLGTLRLLEAVRVLGLAGKTRFYQASTSELFGNTLQPEHKLSETSAFAPCSPYALSKLFAYWACVHYREAHNIFACNGILFNHESPLRGETFVTRKITQAVAKIAHGKQDVLKIGNLNARRDWGHAADYVVGMWLMLQQEQPDDYVLATGESRSVREFIEAAFSYIGVKIRWQGHGALEKGFDEKTGVLRVEIDPQFFRPADVEFLLGDPSKAVKKLGWELKFGFSALVNDMMKNDLHKKS